MDQKIEPIKEPEDTKYVKHIKIQSQKLTEFWGRPTFLAHTFCYRKALMSILMHIIP